MAVTRSKELWGWYWDSNVLAYRSTQQVRCLRIIWIKSPSIRYIQDYFAYIIAFDPELSPPQLNFIACPAPHGSLRLPRPILRQHPVLVTPDNFGCAFLLPLTINMKEHLVDLNVSKVFCIAELLQQQKTKGNTTYRISKPLYAVFMRYEISTICL